MSPLLSNIVLNGLDWWIENQWETSRVIQKIEVTLNKKGTEIKSNLCRAMRKTRLKEMHIVRYADDFRIFCGTRTHAVKTMHAVTQWPWERLRLEILPEKTRIINLKKHYSKFLGFKLKVQKKGESMSSKAISVIRRQSESPKA